MLIDQQLSASKDRTNIHDCAMGPMQLINERRHQPIEKAKVALKRSLPWLELFVHTVSLTIIGVLLWVHRTKTFWSDFDVRKQRRRNMELKAFQYASKAHELFMLSSLSFIVFYYMRKLLVGRKGIPFGLVSAPHLTSSVGMLLKPSFWNGWSRDIPFGGLLFLACIFSVALGPSSAIAMIPSLGWFEMTNAFPANSSTILYNATAPDIWPTKFTASMSLNETEITRCLSNPFNPTNLHCPTAGFMDIFKWFVGFTSTGSRDDLLFTDLLGGGVQRKVAIKTDPDITGATSYVTVITELSSRTLGTFYNYARHNKVGGIMDTAYPRLRITADTPFRQPVVYTTCKMSIWDRESDQYDIIFPQVLASQVWHQDTQKPPPVYIQTDDQIFDGLLTKEAKFAWYKEVGVNLSTSLLAVAIVPIVAINSTGAEYPSSAIVACSSDARWATSNLYYQPINSTTVSSNVTDTLFETEWETDESLITKYGISDKPLDLSLDWAAFLNGNQINGRNDSMTNITGMATFLNIAIAQHDLGDVNTTSFYPPNITARRFSTRTEETVAMLIGTVLADGIARSTSELRPFVKDQSNVTADREVVTILDQYLSLHSDWIWQQEEWIPSLYTVRVKLDSYGYGYGLPNTAVWVAMAVLLLYTLAVLVHVALIGYAFARKQYYGGECWEDVAELIALAMNSAPSEKLYGTSAGVERPETWSSVVKIQETGDRHLELCFVDGQQEDGETVKIGKKYL